MLTQVHKVSTGRSGVAEAPAPVGDVAGLRARFLRACPENGALEGSPGLPRRATRLFDPVHYEQQLPWLIRGKYDPLDHYLTVGWSQGLSPHVAFDADHVAPLLGIDRWDEPPLLAWLEAKSEVSPHPLFDLDVYASHVEVPPGGRLFEAFLEWRPEYRAPFSRFFCLAYYARWEPAVRTGSINPLLHYLVTDPDRRADPNPMVHRLWYNNRYPADLGQPSDPFIRFVKTGIGEGHFPNPFVARQLKLTEGSPCGPTNLIRGYVDVTQTDRMWLGKNGAAPEQRGNQGEQIRLAAAE